MRGCRFWTYVIEWKECYLRSGKVTRVSSRAYARLGFVSGSILSCGKNDKFVSITSA